MSLWDKQMRWCELRKWDSYWHHSSHLSICIFLLHIYVLTVRLSTDATCPLSQCSASQAHTLSVSLQSSSLSPSFCWIYKPLANLSSLSLFEINFSESHHFHFTQRFAHNNSNCCMHKCIWLCVAVAVIIVLKFCKCKYGFRIISICVVPPKVANQVGVT
jgi:hypothetical protein